MPFPAPLDLRHQPGSFYLTLAPFPYQGARDAWTVPAGFRTNLTSVPRPFRWLIDVGGDHALAAVLHDYLTRGTGQGLMPGAARDSDLGSAATQPLTRRQERPAPSRPGRGAPQTPVNCSDADGIFRRVLRELGVSAPRRWCMWAAVRVGCRMQDATRADWWRVLAVGVLAVPFLAVPLLVVLLFGGAFRLLEEVVRVISSRPRRTTWAALMAGFRTFRLWT